MHDDKCAKMRMGFAEMFKNSSELFTALGDANRQIILAALLENPARFMRVGQITERTHLSRPAVSHHLRTLRNAGLVAMRREGTMNFYYADIESTVWRNARVLFGAIDEAMVESRKLSCVRPDTSMKRSAK